MLTLEGFAVTLAADGTAGMDLLSRNQYDLLLILTWRSQAKAVWTCCRESSRCTPSFP